MRQVAPSVKFPDRFTLTKNLLPSQTMKSAALFFLLTLCSSFAAMPPVQTVFIIVMENKQWSAIKGNTNAPYINGILLPQASYCEQYYNPPGNHPSLPNYVWLEAGTNHGITDNLDPAFNHRNTTNHFSTLLNNAGISWKAYQESVNNGTQVPLTYNGLYTPRHNPFVYFDDVTGTNDPNFAYGIAHIRPFTEFATDLTNNTVARYNFITPNLCNDMHDLCAPYNNYIKQGDVWLSSVVPKILASQSYKNNGALFITFDEGDDPADGPIAMIVLSPLARGGGYFNDIRYTHSSTLRTFQEIFAVYPLLGDAANATNLGDLFCSLNFDRITRTTNGCVELSARCVLPGRTNLVQTSTNLLSWTSLSTNSVLTNRFTMLDCLSTNHQTRFYRLVQLP